MKKMNLVFTLTVIMLLMVACSSAEPQQLTEIEGPEAEEVKLFVKSYKELMVEAVNTGDFNPLEPYLITNNSFYHSLRRYASDLHDEKATKELISFEVESVYKDEIDELFVDAKEKVIIHEKRGDDTIERNVRFELVRGEDDSLRIVTIKQR
ncbi:TcaA NTF2-like domain-containing protein [Halalkalibacter nanhaiisediminis]|uniref:TcaA protein NTF2-like domain-containing protein n=1 Tax=Halalkalibacter nanhaiisediminis TaxID=688079 RepID=A0A562QGE4_9BACI|nr:hypothetical protein [Halalkalibacter nanhaiisediminis]TWI55811.1 hypothetical protein IQ10_02371 [Halalkalibacter nanhaiisediminis]